MTAPRQEVIESRVPAVTILATTNTDIAEAPFAGTVTSVGYVPSAAITGANSPASRSVSLVNKKQDGTGTTVIATLSFLSGVNGVADDEKTITLTATAADRVVASGDVLQWQSAPIGATGLADPGGLARVYIDRSRGADVDTRSSTST